MKAHADVLTYVATHPGSEDQFGADVGRPVGIVVFKDGSEATSSRVVVRIANLNGRVIVRTAYVGKG